MRRWILGLCSAGGLAVTGGSAAYAAPPMLNCTVFVEEADVALVATLRSPVPSTVIQSLQFFDGFGKLLVDWSNVQLYTLKRPPLDRIAAFRVDIPPSTEELLKRAASVVVRIGGSAHHSCRIASPFEPPPVSGFAPGLPGELDPSDCEDAWLIPNGYGGCPHCVRQFSECLLASLE